MAPPPLQRSPENVSDYYVILVLRVAERGAPVIVDPTSGELEVISRAAEVELGSKERIRSERLESYLNPVDGLSSPPWIQGLDEAEEVICCFIR
jgi:hypothetical protein